MGIYMALDSPKMWRLGPVLWPIFLHVNLNIPRAPMTSIFEGQPLKTSPFPIQDQNKGHLSSRYLYIFWSVLCIIFVYHGVSLSQGCQYMVHYGTAKVPMLIFTFSQMDKRSKINPSYNRCSTTESVVTGVKLGVFWIPGKSFWKGAPFLCPASWYLSFVRSYHVNGDPQMNEALFIHVAGSPTIEIL